MSQKKLRIGTRDSQLAVWQATLVQYLLKEKGVAAELVYIKSEGDIDTTTPLYELGVQGVFTRALDAALLSERIDIAVHSMKDVPTQLARGITQAAVLKRASYKDIFVYKGTAGFLNDMHSVATIATSSVRRIAQWLNRYPAHTIENLRGNVNTRLKKLEEHNWNGAIFAAAGLERIGLRPPDAIDLDWMLPAPAQGAIMVVCRENDIASFDPLQSFNDPDTVTCTKIERDFLRTLLGGCSTPISALAEVKNGNVHFRGNIISTDGQNKAGIEKIIAVHDAADLGINAAKEILAGDGQQIVDAIRKTGLTP
jgi:hydroxymethylbilane synthase